MELEREKFPLGGIKDQIPSKSAKAGLIVKMGQK